MAGGERTAVNTGDRECCGTSVGTNLAGLYVNETMAVGTTCDFGERCARRGEVTGRPIVIIAGALPTFSITVSSGKRIMPAKT